MFVDGLWKMLVILIETDCLFADLGSDRVKHEWFLIDMEVKEARYSSAGMSLWTPIWGCLRSQDWVGPLSPLGCCYWLNSETLLTSGYWWHIEFKRDMVSSSPIGIGRWDSLHYLLCMSCYVPMTFSTHRFVKQGEDESLNVFVRLCSTFDARRPVSLGFVFPPALTSWCSSNYVGHTSIVESQITMLVHFLKNTAVWLLRLMMANYYALTLCGM